MTREKALERFAGKIRCAEPAITRLQGPNLIADALRELDAYAPGIDIEPPACPTCHGLGIGCRDCHGTGALTPKSPTL